MDRNERIWILAMIVFGILWLLALAAPHVVLFTHGSWWAVVTGILVPVLWLMSMPCTCSTGGLEQFTFG
jgi:hypothetical protein